MNIYIYILYLQFSLPSCQICCHSQDQEEGGERILVSGITAIVTTKYSQPTGRPYGFNAAADDPEFKVKRLETPVPEEVVSMFT